MEVLGEGHTVSSQLPGTFPGHKYLMKIYLADQHMVMSITTFGAQNPRAGFSSIEIPLSSVRGIMIWVQHYWTQG